MKKRTHFGNNPLITPPAVIKVIHLNVYLLEQATKLRISQLLDPPTLEVDPIGSLPFLSLLYFVRLYGVLLGNHTYTLWFFPASLKSVKKVTTISIDSVWDWLNIFYLRGFFRSIFWYKIGDCLSLDFDFYNLYCAFLNLLTIVVYSNSHSETIGLPNLFKFFSVGPLIYCLLPLEISLRWLIQALNQ